MNPKSINRNGEGMLYYPAWMRVYIFDGKLIPEDIAV
jgi:hypothetical protein